MAPGGLGIGTDCGVLISGYDNTQDVRWYYVLYVLLYLFNTNTIHNTVHPLTAELVYYCIYYVL